MSIIKNFSLIITISFFFIHAAYAKNVITIKNTWSPEAPPVTKVMAGYMTIINSSNKNIKIQTIKSQLFKKIEIHLMDTHKGMMRMVKQDNVTIKAKSHIELSPGALHMMLIGRKQAIKAGESIPLTFIFNNGEIVKANLKVKKNTPPQMKCGGKMKHH